MTRDFCCVVTKNKFYPGGNRTAVIAAGVAFVPSLEVHSQSSRSLEVEIKLLLRPTEIAVHHL